MPSLPIEHEGVEVLSYYRPDEHHLQLSGDFIDVLDRGMAGVAVICGDVRGHGPRPAALGAMLRAGWQALGVSGSGPATIVDSLLAALERKRKNLLSYATMCRAWIVARGQEVTLLSVGHPAPLLVAGREVTPVPCDAHAAHRHRRGPVEAPLRIALPAGWRLFFYTDGLIEAAQTLDGDVVDLESLERLLADVEAAGGEPLADGVTVILISQAS